MDLEDFKVLERFNSIWDGENYSSLDAMNEYGVSPLYLAITFNQNELPLSNQDFKYMLYHCDLKQPTVKDKNYVSLLFQYNKINNLQLTDDDIWHCLKNGDISVGNDDYMPVISYYLNAVAAKQINLNQEHLEYLIENTDFNRYIKEMPMANVLLEIVEEVNYDEDIITFEQIKKIYERTDIDTWIKEFKNLDDEEAYDLFVPAILKLSDKVLQSKMKSKKNGGMK